MNLGMSEEQIKQLQRAQNLSQQLRLLEERKQLLDRRKLEIKEALEELNKAKERGEKEAYRFLGSSIMIKKEIDEIVSDLEEELMLIDTQLGQLEKQLSVGKKELENLLKALGFQSGGPSSAGG
jgi:chaperonin cofactor prefoldin